jgi:hypothetical protein
MISHIAAGIMKCIQCDKKIHAACLERIEAEKHLQCKPTLQNFWYTDDPVRQFNSIKSYI